MTIYVALVAVIGSAFAAVATEPRRGVRWWWWVAAPLVTMVALIYLSNGVRPLAAIPTKVSSVRNPLAAKSRTPAEGSSSDASVARLDPRRRT